jgi:hypothetical protein
MLWQSALVLALVLALGLVIEPMPARNAETAHRVLTARA